MSSAPATPPSGPAQPAGATASATPDEPVQLVLSAASGATDAFAFLCLGKVFAGVMTGNLVLVGASVGVGDHQVVPRALAALAGYGLGAAAAGRARPGVPVRALLAAGTGLLAAAAVAWALGSGRSLPGQLVLIVAVSLAMGLQAQTWPVPTTYFTGTFTALLSRAGRRQLLHEDRWPALRLAAVVVGAAATSLLAWCCLPAAGTAAAALSALALALTLVPRHNTPPAM
ncbi:MULTISPECIES: YoaK family protein [Streptacidiphilus]|uniref:YoaK family protein n=1 Tax=Streptacidiphilus cavernicola TaxID=3342716 RepID=A0ABV6UIZ0_9ACTN|nr:YoaK family protein [Streptacidiphilus jeojiense]